MSLFARLASTGESASKYRLENLHFIFFFPPTDHLVEISCSLLASDFSSNAYSRTYSYTEEMSVEV